MSKTAEVPPADAERTMTERPIRILLADDHTLVRAGIRGLLDATAGFEVVGEVGDGLEALRLAESLRPDVLLLDVAMPGLSGLEVTALVSGRSLPTKVLILSVHAAEEYVVQALQAGAAGYLVKGSDVAELEAAIRAVAGGERYVGRGISPDLGTPTGVSPASDPPGPAVPDPLAALTARQREILRLVALGHTSRQIGELLDLSARTVEAHRRQIMDRLDVHDLAGLVRLSIRAGLITAEG